MYYKAGVNYVFSVEKLQNSSNINVIFSVVNQVLSTLQPQYAYKISKT